MKTKVALIIIIGFIVAILFQSIAIAATDAPHNASNNINCGSCHGETLMDSPFWGTGTYDELCLSCHRRSTGCSYSQTDAPVEKTHSDSNDNALAECRTCHNPHYQRQKVYKNTDANNLYLATGTITSCSYNAGSEESTLTYSTITYKTATGWNAAKLIGKTETCRHTILFPNMNKLGYNYPIIGVNEGAYTITVKGDACVFPPPTTFAAIYGQYIKNIIVVDGTNKTVKFFDQTGTNSFADGDTTYNGVCEVCHTQTKYHKNDGSGALHYATMNCTSCHPHTNGFAHGGGGGGGCDSCHGHSGSHYRHSDVDPPATACGDCHNTSSYPGFSDGKNLSETTVCNTCHSPSGAFDGVTNAVIGAKPNWDQGAYQDTYPGTLRSGKEKWCAGCHDNIPSVVKGTTAPDIAGNNSTYGYYLDAHGDTGYGVSRQGVSYSKGECLHCHDVSVTGHGGQLFDTSVEFCLKCHDYTTTYATTAIKNRSYSYRAGNYSTDTLDSIKKAFTNPPSISSHKLSDIKTFINGKWGYDADSNACASCHNPHRVQGDPEHSDAAKSSTTRGYPVARPSEHSTNYNNLWGDASNEKMSNYTTKYQAPYRTAGSNYEPDGSSTTDGSNLTDYNTYCTDCHNTTYTIYSTTLGRDLRQIDWNNEIHGKGDPNDGSTNYAKLCGDLPYPSGLFDGLTNKKVLSCLDCHEPHGSPNVTLIRKKVNGSIISSAITSISQTSCLVNNHDVSMGYLCNKCHKDDYQIDTNCTSGRWYKVHHRDGNVGEDGCVTDSPYSIGAGCSTCHGQAGMTFGCNVDASKLTPTGCICCHYHGSSVDATHYPPRWDPKTRRTF